MDTRSCAHHKCDQEFTTNHPTKKYCSQSCKSAAKSARYREANPDKVAAIMKRWQQANPDKVAANRKRWDQANPDKAAAYRKRWDQANPDKVAARKKRWRAANPDKAAACRKRWKQANPEKVQEYRKDRYHSRTVPLGQRLQERLDDLFRAQAAVDPSRLPQLASRVLSWRPKGYIEIADYALHPYGPLEADWMYYAEMSPEEAVEVYALED